MESRKEDDARAGVPASLDQGGHHRTEVEDRPTATTEYGYVKQFTTELQFSKDGKLKAVPQSRGRK